MDDNLYHDSYLKTAQCLKIAQGAISNALVMIEGGSAGPMLVDKLKQVQDDIRKLMK